MVLLDKEKASSRKEPINDSFFFFSFHKILLLEVSKILLLEVGKVL